MSVCILVLTLVGGLGTPVAAAPGGNSANAKLCQKGGWEVLERTDGTTFTGQDSCVSYAAQGGQLVERSFPRVVVIVSPFDGQFCPITITLVGADPGTIVKVAVATSVSPQFGPTFIAPTFVQQTGFLVPGMSLVSGSAELLDDERMPTGVLIPVDYPTAACTG